jgi:hypothetical protein
MANIHFARDGLSKNGDASTTSQNINPEQLEQLFSGFDFQFSKSPPRINPETLVNDFAAYRHVVLEIEDGESTLTFSKVGYYFIPILSVEECQQLIDNA